ncbi:hypothetical protein P5673_028534 [Acropora cervicornis]|uniref:Uncharacterized protein n=1 Tax=Acropora cervicornis TaxID=6130 RepID=A0AAD9PXI4_ACRCE|nr:hypothetical protein P5673_028534 [Acropora cervicornis]
MLRFATTADILKKLESPDSCDTILQQYKSTTKMNLLPTTQTKVLTLSCMDALERSLSIPNCGLYFPMVSHVLKEGSLIIKTS